MGIGNWRTQITTKKLALHYHKVSSWRGWVLNLLLVDEICFWNLLLDFTCLLLYDAKSYIPDLSAKGINACYERSKSCLDGCDDCCDKQLHGWYGAIQRLLQRSQYQMQYSRPLQVVFSTVLLLGLIGELAWTLTRSCHLLLHLFFNNFIRVMYIYLLHVSGGKR